MMPGDDPQSGDDDRDNGHWQGDQRPHGSCCGCLQNGQDHGHNAQLLKDRAQL